MDVSRAEKARLGIFLLGALAILAGTLFFLVGKRLLTPTVPYFTRLQESVSGLELGAPVKLNGVEIGVITGIRTDPDDITKAVVEFVVRSDASMKTDMVATLGTFGITGLKYIEITGGNYDSPDLPAGGAVPSQPSTLGRILNRADTIALKVDNLLGNMVALTSNENRDNIDRLIASSAALSQALEGLVADVSRLHPGERMERILVQLESLAGGMRGELQQLRLAETVEEYRRAAKEINQLATRADVTLLKVQEDLTQAMGSMKEAMQNMSTFSRQIKDNPSVLLRREEKRERRR